MPVVGAIEAFTRVAAELVGLDADLGTLEAGKLADFVVVGGDPLQNPQAITDALAVVRSGRTMDSLRVRPPAATPGRVERDLRTSDRTEPERSRHF